MKKFLIPYTIVISSILIIFSVLTINTGKTPPKTEITQDKKTQLNPVKSANPAPETEPETNEDETEFYTIRYDGSKTNVYDKDDNVVRSLNINFPSLREYDKDQLKRGVTVYSVEEVNEFAEDFMG